MLSAYPIHSGYRTTSSTNALSMSDFLHFSAPLRAIRQMRGLSDKNHPHKIVIPSFSENAKTKIRLFCIITSLFLFFCGGILAE
jgi:hypothetical protein